MKAISESLQLLHSRAIVHSNAQLITWRTDRQTTRLQYAVAPPLGIITSSTYHTIRQYMYSSVVLISVQCSQLFQYV